MDINDEINKEINKNCGLLPYTKVITQDYLLKRGDEVVVGDILIDCLGENVRVKGVDSLVTGETVSIRLSNDSINKSDFSYNHLIKMMDGSFKKAGKLKPMDYIAFPRLTYAGPKRGAKIRLEELGGGLNVSAEEEVSSVWEAEDWYYLVGMFAARGSIRNNTLRIDGMDIMLSVATSLDYRVNKYGTTLKFDYVTGDLYIKSRLVCDAMEFYCSRLGLAMHRYLTPLAIGKSIPVNYIEALADGFFTIISKNGEVPNITGYQLRNIGYNLGNRLLKIQKSDRPENCLIVPCQEGDIILGEDEVYVKVTMVSSRKKETRVINYEFDRDSNFCTASIVTGSV